MLSILDINSDGQADEKDLELFLNYRSSSTLERVHEKRIKAITAFIPVDDAISFLEDGSNSAVTPEEIFLSEDQYELFSDDIGSFQYVIAYHSKKYVRMPSIVQYQEDSEDNGIIYKNISLIVPSQIEYKDIVFVDYFPWVVVSSSYHLLTYKCNARSLVRSKRLKGGP